MTYKSIIDTTNKNNSHSITIDLLTKRANKKLLKILDVGCSEGYLGEYFKKLGHTVVGVEMDPHAAHKATIVLDYVYKGSIQNYFKDHYEENFDAILFGDVLEHISDPKQILEICHNHLSQNGFIISSLPNVAHAAIRTMLLEGRWNYSDLGILDKTHLRFFTKDSAKKLFEESNYEIQEIKQVHLPINLVDKICDLNLNPQYISIVNSLISDDTEASVFQNIFLATPKNKNTTRIVAYVPNKDLALHDIRIKRPLDTWQIKHNGSVRYRDYSEIRVEDLYWGDIFVFQRVGGEYILNLMTVLQHYGKKCIFELDDLLTEIPDFLAHHKMSPKTLISYHAVIAKADMITTTTLRLRSRLLKINPQVTCIQNCAESLGFPLALQTNDPNHKITLVVASSDKVLVNFLAPALLKIQQDFPNTYEIFVIGPPGDYLESVGIKITRSDLLGHDDFKKVLTQLINPIGLIPLDDSIFSSCKSPIKFFDYTLAGLAVICSNVPPYSDYITHEQTGLLVKNNTDSWVDAIITISNSIELRKNLIQNALAYVEESFSLNVAGDAWQSVVDKLDIIRTGNTALLKPETYQLGILKTYSDENGLYLDVQKNITVIIKHLLNITVYPKIYRVLRSEGIKGLIRRLKYI